MKLEVSLFLFSFFPSLSKKLRRLLIIFRFDCLGGFFSSSPQFHYTVIRYILILVCWCFSLYRLSQERISRLGLGPLPPHFLFPLGDALIGDISSFLFLSLLSCLGILVGKVRNKKVDGSRVGKWKMENGVFIVGFM